LETSILCTPQFFQSPSTSSILPLYAEAWAIIIVNMQSSPSSTVSSPFYDPCVLAFTNDEAKVSSA